ncbi:MAG: phage tail protein [Alphaproteobacteria bacterium]|nr:MAG: phage tail protein [Alphaproteobacteria bacterium]
MSQFYVGQIMMTGFGFAQKYFAQCNGQILGINQNQALFSLLGTVYGGDGSTTFALPDLRSRTPIGGIQSVDGGWNPPRTQMGQIAGSENVTLNVTQMPAHNHMVGVNSAAATNPSLRGDGLTLATAEPNTNLPYGPGAQPAILSPQTCGMAGGNQPHPNLQPYTAINFNIALQGIFPSRN